MASTGKRQRDAEGGDRNGRNKRRNQFGGDREPLPPLPSPDDTIYRILCPADKIGGLIGKGGSRIKSIRRESRARIKVTDPVPGVDERVVLIWSSPIGQGRGEGVDGEGRKRNEEDNGSLKEKDGDEATDERDEGEEREERDEGDERDEQDKRKFVCPAQEALFKVHDRIVEDDGGPVSEENEQDASVQVTARLLVPNIQIGCLIGKGGKVIEKLREETHAQIRILSKAQIPGCALPSDELVAISGDPAVVKNAMYEISARIYENPPRDRPQGAVSFMPQESLFPPGGPGIFPSGNFLPPRNSMLGSGNVGSSILGFGPLPFSGLAGAGSLGSGPAWPMSSPGVPIVPPPLFGSFGSVDPGPTWPMNSRVGPDLPTRNAPYSEWKEPSAAQEFSIRVLCSNDKIGYVIGKGGNAIRQMRESTRARIKIEASVADSDERVIAISADEFLDDAMSPVIEAALQLQSKIGESGGEKEGIITTRLLVPSKQIGCLLGRKGSVIHEMRKKTTATIKVLHKVDLPKCAQEKDELVQIIGEEFIARSALIEVLSRLRNNVFKGQIEAQGKFGGGATTSLPIHGGIPVTPSSLISSYGIDSPSQMYPSSGLGPRGRFLAGYDSPGPLQGTGSDYGTISAYGKVLPTGDSTAGASDFNDGLLKNISEPAVEVTIPGALVNNVLGVGSANLSKICQISGAKVKLHDPSPGSGDRTVEISGSPDQTQAAKSLLQGFIYSGQVGQRQSY